VTHTLRWSVVRKRCCECKVESKRARGHLTFDVERVDNASIGMRRVQSEPTLPVSTAGYIHGPDTPSPSATSAASSTAASNSADSAHVILGAIHGEGGWQRNDVGTWEPCSFQASAKSIRLSDVQSLAKGPSGKPWSVGSLMHDDDNERDCKVCAFAKKGHGVCRHGALCQYCHANHTPYPRTVKRHSRGNRKSRVCETVEALATTVPQRNRS